MQRDPIGYLAGANLYAYVSGRPTGFTDAYGLQEAPGMQATCCADKKKHSNEEGNGKMKLGSAEDPSGDANPSNNTSKMGKALRTLVEQFGGAAEFAKMGMAAAETANPVLDEAKKDAREKAEKNCSTFCEQGSCESGDKCESEVKNGKYHDGKVGFTPKRGSIEPRGDRVKVENGEDLVYNTYIIYTYDCECSCKPGALKKFKRGLFGDPTPPPPPPTPPVPIPKAPPGGMPVPWPFGF